TRRRVWSDFLARLWAGMETIRYPGPTAGASGPVSRPTPSNVPSPGPLSAQRARTTPRPPLSRRTTGPSRLHRPIMYVTNHLILPDRQPAPHDLEKNLESLRSSVAEI